MTKEALKLALEALEHACGDRCNAEYNPCFQREAIIAIKEALANEALDKMAENARELGLDYEPAQRTWVGLTDDEIDIAWRSVNYTVPYAQFRIDVAKAIEAKLKDKNAGR